MSAIATPATATPKAATAKAATAKADRAAIAAAGAGAGDADADVALGAPGAPAVQVAVMDPPHRVMEATPAVRIDRWLWAVRLYKTRSAAAAACQGGKVASNGIRAKPARAVRMGDIIVAQIGTLTRTVKVLAVLEQRVGAALVARYMEDLTSPAEYEAARDRDRAAGGPVGHRPPGAGRPTKRDRRLLQSFFGEDDPH